MKTKSAFRLLLPVCLLALLCLSAFAAGETVISDAAALGRLMDDPAAWSGSYRLGADIDLGSVKQSPIGNYETPFTGSFDGAGHTISGLNIKADGTAGLFGVLSGASVTDLTVKGGVVNSFAATDAETKLDEKYSGTGGIAGVALSGTTLKNCVSRASVKGPCNVGGLVGIIYNYDLFSVSVTDCENYGEISPALGNAGGLIGRIQVNSSATPAVYVGGCVNHADVRSVSEDRNRLAGIAGYVRTEAGVILIENCENEGKITGANSGAKASNCPFVGGIAGRIEIVTDASSAVRILNCKNTGAIDSLHHAGGIAGYINRSDKALETASEIVGCLNTAAVNGPSHAGGIVGYSENRCAADVRSAIKNCLNTGAVTSSACAGGIVGRWYGFDILTCFVAGNVSATDLCGAFAGKADGSVFCEIDSVYLDSVATLAVGESNPLCVELGAKSVGAANVGKTDSFPGFDFKTVWTMEKNGPTLTAFAGGKLPQTTTAPATEKPDATEATETTEATSAESTAATADSAETAESTAETTASTEQTTEATAESKETAVSTASTEATAETPETEGGSSTLWIVLGVVAVVVIAAVVAVVIIKKKKA